MRNISFSLTTHQVRHGFETGEILKDVTRRLGWANARIGEHLCACEKCMGLGPGGQLVRLGVIQLVHVGLQRLDAMLSDPAYGREEVRREGFPELTPEQFVAMFCKHMRCFPSDIITRLEFRYVKAL